MGMEEAFTRRRHLHDGRGLFRENKGFFEPLINPDFLALQRLVREQEPESVIDVTTNGALSEPRADRRAQRTQAHRRQHLIDLLG